LTILGVVVALEIEARGLVKKSVIKGGATCLPEGILLEISGNGAEHGRLAAETLIKDGATSLLTWGSAGALHPILSPGSLIIPEKVLLPNQIGLAVDVAWHRRLFTYLSEHFKLYTGPLFQSPTILTSPLEKGKLFRQHGAIAVDMESAAVADVARQAQVPFVFQPVHSPPLMSTADCAFCACLKAWPGILKSFPFYFALDETSMLP
jgi:adenosylhomocysteine nucleosidase